MKILSKLCFVLLGLISLGSAPAAAAPNIEVFTSIEPTYTIQREKDSHFLGTQMGVHSPNAEAESQRIATGRAGGTNTATIDRSIEIDIDYLSDSNRIRIKISSARIHFHYRDIILHIASDLPPCFYQVAVDHELRHVQNKRSVLATYEQRFRNRLAGILAPADGMLISESEIDKHHNDLYASAYAAIDAEVQSMYRDVEALDAPIDDVNAVMIEYNAARQKCR